MKFLSRVGIVAKISGGFGLLVVLLVVLAVVSYQGLQTARNDFVQYRHLARQNNALGRIQANFVEIRLHVGQYLANGAEESIRQVRERANRLGPLIADAQSLFDDRDAGAVLGGVERDSREYVAAFFRILELRPGDAERERLVRDNFERLGPAVDATTEAMKLANLARQDALGPRASADVEQTALTAVTVSIIAILLAVAAALVLSGAITRPTMAMAAAMRRLAEGELDVEVPARHHRGEIGAMAKAVQVFKDALGRMNEQQMLRAQIAELSTALQLADSPEAFAKALLGRLAPALGAGLGLFYVRDGTSGRFRVAGGYACEGEAALLRSFASGEGLPGQCAASGRTMIVGDLPADTDLIRSGLAAGRPDMVACIPVAAPEGVLGVIEIARYGAFTAGQRDLLDQVAPVVALNLGLLERNLRTAALLDHTRMQADELRIQTEELQASEDELRVQREELQAANDALEQKTGILERQAVELQAASADAGKRAAEIASASQYKSQFLANMSHELRTPLNSILILAKTLAEDDNANLSGDQIESARMIGEGGQHLLGLINDILDLSKIEAGKLDLDAEDFRLDEVLGYVKRVSMPEAARKGIELVMDVASGAPAVIRADRQRFSQVLINLVGNAVKFTDHGEVRLTAESADGSDLRVTVKDTGIGIAADRIDAIFGAFRQGDGATSRRYGGTGLGLAISKSLVELMGGTITVSSTPGSGSAFCIALPMVAAPSLAESEGADRRSDPAGIPVLVVEPDRALAAIFDRLIGSLGYAVIGADSGEAAIAAMARHQPAAILLDLDLPDIPGLDVLRRLKADPAGAAIPMYVIASDADRWGAAKTLGAMGRISKPVTRDEIVAALAAMTGFRATDPERRRVLVVEDNAIDARALQTMFRHDAVDLVVARTGDEAMHRLADGRFDAIVLDLMLPDTSGFALLERICAEPERHPPVVVYSACDLTQDDVCRLRGFAESIVVKGRANSRLREEVLQAVDSPRDSDAAAGEAGESRLAGRRLLVVDDDVRNLVALSKMLRLKEFDVEVASDGGKALELMENGRFDAVLTDLMMPGMDGCELIRRIRAGFGSLPIIAVTAKAMKGDADLCLQAGADDYLSKPIDVGRLLGMLERWLA